MKALRIASNALKLTANANAAPALGSNACTMYLKEVGEIPKRSSSRMGPSKSGCQHPKLVSFLLWKYLKELLISQNAVDFVNEPGINDDDNINHNSTADITSTHPHVSEIGPRHTLPSVEDPYNSPPSSSLAEVPVSSSNLSPNAVQNSFHEHPQAAQGAAQEDWDSSQQAFASPVSAFPNISSPNDSIAARFTSTRNFTVPRVYQNLSTQVLSRREAFLLRIYVEKLSPWVRDPL